jgi:hypothetical protein
MMEKFKFPSQLLAAPHSLSLSQFDILLATHHGIMDGRPINKSEKLVLRQSVCTLSAR